MGRRSRRRATKRGALVDLVDSSRRSGPAWTRLVWRFPRQRAFERRSRFHSRRSSPLRPFGPLRPLSRIPTLAFRLAKTGKPVEYRAKFSLV
jgi:hypothetical protein